MLYSLVQEKCNLFFLSCVILLNVLLKVLLKIQTSIQSVCACSTLSYLNMCIILKPVLHSDKGAYI